MVSAKALVYDDRKTAGLLEMQAEHRPCGAQLFGSEPDVMAEAARKTVEICKPDFIDINMGCPFPIQVKHGKGAGLLDNPAKIEQIAHSITKYPHIEFSIKMRLGNTVATQWKNIQAIINGTPIKHITLHPRIATQQYSGQPDIDAFTEFYENITHPIIYNGDIVTIYDISNIVNLFPNLAGVMIGRGLLSRPSLIMEYINNNELSSNQRVELFMKFHDKLFEYYQKKLCGEAQILNKLKSIWDYNESMIGHKLYKLIKKASSIKKYDQIINTISKQN